MPTFRYRAVTRAGEALAGELDAADHRSAIARLQAQGHIPLSATAIHVGTLQAFLTKDLFGGRGLSSKALADLLQQLATLVGAGIPLEQTLGMLTARDADARLRWVAGELRRRVRDGSCLSEAMRAESRAFPRIAIAMVRAGESSGALDTALARLAVYVRSIESIKESVRSALIYPAILVVTAFISILVILTVVLPQLKPLLHDTASLPFATQLVLNVSDLVRDYWWLLAAMLGATGISIYRFLINPSRRLGRDAVLLRLPLVGTAIKRAEAARFSRTLGVLVTANVPLPSALAMAEAALGNMAIAEAVSRVTRSLKEGGGLAEPLAATAMFPELAIQMIRIGEATGQLDEMLTKQADIFETEVRRLIERLLALLVPILTVTLGLVIAGLIASVLAALLSINDLVN